MARANLPATFPVPGGVVEVAAGQYGVKRAHLVTDGGAEHLLTPHPGSLEGRRARLAQRFPRASWAVGAVAVVVILVGGLLALGRGLEAVTHSPAIAAQVGTFTMPFHLSPTGLVVVGVLTALAGTERAITFRSRFLIDRRPGRRPRG
ncbi:hypothetical protein WCD74_26885 [Actinomycetospora sp. OC33-EN08]|uniref:Uncharacterized protein n=1 Tax=Actinomycetospora aurantiaca TaxID=3129233 RepID=A0ABU8MVT1_9PSEU